jgi:hypothetical protein
MAKIKGLTARLKPRPSQNDNKSTVTISRSEKPDPAKPAGTGHPARP